MRGARLRVGLLDSHPIQYHAPWFRGLAQACDLTVFFAHRQSADEQASAGYGVAFDWDTDLLRGYAHELLHNVSRAPNVFSFGGCDTPEVADRIATGGFDAVIVSGWYLKAYWQAVVACKRRGVPVLARCDSHLGRPRGRLRNAAKRVAYPYLLSAFDGFLSAGKRNAAYLRHYRVPEHKIHFVPRFVDNDFFRERSRLSVAERRHERERMGARDGDRVALFVGRLIELKRATDLVEAIAALGPQREQFVAAFAGAGAEEPRIRALAERAGVRTALLGFQNQSQLPRTYAAADFLVLPSHEESWGLVVNEAMACGRPALTSDAVGCSADLIEANRTGFTFEMGDARALAGAMQDMLALLDDPELDARVLAKVDEYSPARAVENTLRAIERVAAERR